MSNLRDDTQETVTISTSTWSRTRELVVEVAKAATFLLGVVSVSHADTVTIGDEVFDRLRHTVEETAMISESHGDALRAVNLISERAKISDKDLSYTHYFELIAEATVISDELHDKSKIFVSDVLRISDSTSGTQYAGGLVNETLKLRDSVFQKNHTSELVQESIEVADSITEGKLLLITDNFKISDSAYGKTLTSSLVNESLKIRDSVVSERLISDLIEESLQVAVSVQDRLLAVTQEELTISDEVSGLRKTQALLHDRVKISDDLFGVRRIQIEDFATISDEAFGTRKLTELVDVQANLVDEIIQTNRQFEMIFDTFKVSDQSYGTLKAESLAVETLLIEDDVVGENLISDWAWTGNTDTWGMSRYSDYPYSELTVIDGTLYGVTVNGIYALDSDQKLVGKFTTAKIDIGEGGLVHPNAAYLEYVLSGDDKELGITVSTTQSGDERKYTYYLPKENSNYLTNGRVIFGRGLRGRHFAFELSVRATNAQINDLSIDFTKTKRRV